jgi:SH3 domain-containing YSC84-like protein 1
MQRVIAGLCLSLVFTSTALAKSSKDQLQLRIDSAKIVLDQIMGAKDKTIPGDILRKAVCLAVIPDTKSGALFVGAEHGEGVVTCRKANGWSAPVFISLTGGSIGFQFGGEVTDLVLVAVNSDGMQHLLKDKFKIGADASVAVGPVGRSGEAATDIKANAELLSYSRSKGLLAGIDLSGVTVSQNKTDTETYYGADEDFTNVLQGNVPVPAGAVTFLQDVQQNFAAEAAAH